MKYIILLVGVDEKVQKTLPEGVIGISRTQNQHELALLYAGADLFIIPTYADNYPTTNLEAMACGTPVITYDTGGSPEAITQETGWVVGKGDVKMLAEIVESGIYKTVPMRAACRKRAEQFFTQDKCFNDYLDLYN